MATAQKERDLLIEVRDLKTYFFLDEGTVRAIDGVDFDIKRGQTLGVVGESGCGKSVTGQSILRIVPDELPDEAVAGLEEDLIHLLIELRREFRANRQWQEADAIRDRLAALGVQLEDKPEGTTYRLEAAL